MMAMAMRQFFIKSLKKFLATGQMKSKYFYKFEVSMTGKDSLIIDDLTYLSIDSWCYLAQVLRDPAKESLCSKSEPKPPKVHLQAASRRLNQHLLRHSQPKRCPSQLHHRLLDQPRAEDALHCHGIRSVPRLPSLHADDRIRRWLWQRLQSTEEGQVRHVVRINTTATHSNGLPVCDPDVTRFLLRPHMQPNPREIWPDAGSARQLNVWV